MNYTVQNLCMWGMDAICSLRKFFDAFRRDVLSFQSVYFLMYRILEKDGMGDTDCK